MQATVNTIYQDSYQTTQPASRWAKAQETMLLWYARARQRRQLARLSSEHLWDIGLTSAQAQQEAAKPFWRA